MDQSKNRHSVIPRTLSFVMSQGKVLLIKASDEKAWSGIYNPIGGHIEEGEDILEAANREIFEEAQISAPDTSLVGIIHANNFFQKQIMLFITLSHIDIPSPILSTHEGSLAWIAVNELKSLPLHPDILPILDHLITNPGVFFTGTSQYSPDNQLVNFELHSHPLSS